MLKHFRLQILARLALVVAVALGLTYLVGWTRLYAAQVLAAGALAWSVAGLVRYTEKTTRDLTRFLEGIRHDDLSQGFISKGRGPLFDELSAAFSDVTDAFREIRAEKQEQVRYLENVVRHVGIALIAFRAGDGSVELINQAARRLLNTHRVRHVDALAEVSTPLVEAMASLDSGEQTLVRFPRKDRVLELSVYVTKFRLRDRAFTLASIQDIRRELEEKEMDAWQQLTRVLTHEIMNSVAPITSLAGTTRRLLGEGDGAAPSDDALSDAREAAATIEQRGEGLVQFVETYRSFTKLPQPDYEMIDVRDLLERVRRLLQAQIEAQDVRCEIRAQPPDLTLTADPELVEQVLINLLLNALEAVEDRGDAAVVLSAEADAGGVPVLRVRDDGPGIPPDVQEKIFVPFFTTREDGSGIGLPLSRQIMRLHGGTLGVRSEPGETVFTLRF